MNELMNVPMIRSLTWRLGRKLYCMARREGGNSPELNGEYWLLGHVIAAHSGPGTILMDIGANIGDWTARATAELARQGMPGHVHAFEPTASTFTCLTNRFGSNNQVTCNHIALSDRVGVAEFFVVGEQAGTNSLVKADGASTESVNTETFDGSLAEQKIDHVLFVKSDTEGHDFNVLKGASESLRLGKVDVWQFEYNHRWIGTGASLKGVFDFIADKPYRLGKLFGNGVELYEHWHQELDRFIETNYVLVKLGSEAGISSAQYHFDVSNTPQPSPTR